MHLVLGDMKYMFAQHVLQLEPISSINAIRIFVAIKTFLNKFATSLVVENVDEVLLSIESTVIFFSSYCTKSLGY